MFRLEVRLVATEGSLDSEVPVARTADPRAVSAVADTVVAEAQAEAAALERRDPVLGLLARSEARKLARIVRVLEGREQRGLGLVPGSCGTP